MLEFNDVQSSYDGRIVFENVSFNMGKGEFIYLVGQSGTGKSTLLKLIYMDHFPDRGTVRFHEYSSASITKKEIPYLRRRIGVVFQDFKLLPDRDVFENIAFALHVTGAKRKDIHTKVMKVLSEVGLTHKRNSMPHELSGGEQQRVVVARALVNDPYLLLADEPTGNLDPEVADDIMKLLLRINAMGTGILMATHDYNLVKKYPQRIFQLKEKAIQEVVLKA
ncbi:MAG: cell division ATP-binding protein FtsE [Bacteroidetes bacterium]|nr:cell division ATP-binding protein FtsE [Bacteroidota bacterium]